jgi:hypothetical protein
MLPPDLRATERGLGMRVRRTGLVSVAMAALVCLLVIGTATAPAGNRDPVSVLVPTPGPAEINYGESVGYSASLTNTQSSTFTKVIYRHRVPPSVVVGTR